MAALRRADDDVVHRAMSIRCLQRARDTQWVVPTSGAHTWTDPVVSDASPQRDFQPTEGAGGAGGDMPALNEATTDGRLTAVQYAHMQRWNDNTFANDWAGVPAPQARSRRKGSTARRWKRALAARFSRHRGRRSRRHATTDPGRPNYIEPFRINQAVVVRRRPVLCDGVAVASRLLRLRRQLVARATARLGLSARNVDSTGLGSFARQLRRHDREMEHAGLRRASRHQARRSRRCDTATITLMTPTLNYQDVPQGPMGTVTRSGAGDHVRGHFALQQRHAAIRGGRRSVPSATDCLQHVRVSRTDRGEQRSDGPALADLPDQQRRRCPTAADAARAGLECDTAMDDYRHRQHRGSQDRGGGTRARPLGQHVRRSRRRTEPSTTRCNRQPAASST